MSIKLLYLSSFHPTLEYDDLILFSELNLDWISNGLYKNPRIPESPCLRSSIDKDSNPEILKMLKVTGHLSKELIDHFDVIFISNHVSYLIRNWEVLKNKPVILRTYDAHSIPNEAILSKLVKEGLTLVRMYDWENNLPFSTKTPNVISHYADENVYYGWRGEDKVVLTFQHHFKTRANHYDEWGNHVYPNYLVYLEIAKHIPYKLHGLDNHIPLSSGPVDWNTQKELLKSSRAYFSLGTKPSPYTYNLMEAMMTGCPTINFGKKLGTYNIPMFKDTYTLPDMLTNGVDGFYSDDPQELINISNELIRNETLAKQISDNGRKLALKYFSKAAQAKKWKALFNSVVGPL